MAAFDMEEAARLGRTNTFPSTWTKFPVSRSAIWRNCIIYILGALLVFGVAFYLIDPGLLPGGSNTSSNQAIAPFEFVAFLIFGCVFLGVGLRKIPVLLKSDQYFLLITTAGFVYVADKKLVGLPFAEISSATRQPGWLGGKLVVRRPAGRSLVLPIGHFYSVRTIREIEETLTAALTPPNQGKCQR
jgi:hypothetical protein